MSPLDYELTVANHPWLKLPRQLWMIHPQIRERILVMTPAELIAGRTAVLLAEPEEPPDCHFGYYSEITPGIIRSASGIPEV